MNKKYSSSKHFVFQLIFVVFPVLVCAMLLYLVLLELSTSGKSSFDWVPVIFLISSLFITYRIIKTYQKAHYRIAGNYLQYRCGFSKGEIQLSSIRSITPSSYPAAGLRPALDLKGVQIIHGEGYSIFISPENRSEFIRQLKMEIGESKQEDGRLANK